MTHVQQRLRVAERRACRVLGQSRATQRRVLRVAEDELRLVARIVELARAYGRYGYRRITALLRREGWRRLRARIPHPIWGHRTRDIIDAIVESEWESGGRS